MDFGLCESKIGRSLALPVAGSVLRPGDIFKDSFKQRGMQLVDYAAYPEKLGAEKSCRILKENCFWNEAVRKVRTKDHSCIIKEVSK